MATKDKKVEVGSVVRVTGQVDVKSPHWFKPRLVPGDFLIFMGNSVAGVSYLLLDLDEGAVQVVGIDADGEPTLTLVTTAEGVSLVMTPTRRDLLSLQRGDAVKGEVYTTLSRAVAQTSNGHRSGYTAPVGSEG